MRSRHFQVDRGTTERAVRLAAQANAPGTLQLVVTLDKDDRQKEFSGSVFVVVRDPVTPAPGTRLSIRDYYIAAVELAGTSPWLGKSTSFVVHPAQASASAGTCCGPATTCVPDAPGTTGCGPNGFCTGPDLAVIPALPNAPGWARNAAGPAVQLRVFRSGSGNVQATMFSGSCHERVANASCGIAHSYCQAGDAGFVQTADGGADVNVGSACAPGSRPVNGKEVPEWCLYAYHDSPNAAECRGLSFEGMEASLKRVLGSTSPADDFLPPMCERARTSEDSNVCTTASEQKQQKDLDEGMVRASFAFRGGGPRCQPTGTQVQDARGLWGLSQCSQCEPGLTGHCRQWVELTSVSATDGDGNGNTAGQPHTVNFDAVVITGKKAASENNPQREVKFDDQYIVVRRVKTEKPIKDDDNKKERITRTQNPPDHTIHDTSPDTPQNPDPNKKRPNSNANAKGTETINRTPGRKNGKKGDPILLGDGSFDLRQVDLSFPGPVEPLEFVRTYNSRSQDRGTLGSNWIHNWDVWLERLNRDNTPGWAMPYCLGTDIELVPRFGSDPPGSEPRTTCLILHRGDAAAQLFFLDLGTYLYMPQSGSTDTIRNLGDGGWILRSKNGDIQRFNSAGFLVDQRDRFGNGFAIEYEPTPIWDLYTQYCTASQLAQLNESKYGRRCAFLAHMVGDGPPASLLPGWTLGPNDYPLPGDLQLRPRLDYAVAYFLYLNSIGYDVLPPYGARRLRPTRITDDLGRTLIFTYTHAPRCTLTHPCAGRYDFANTPQAELLESVIGPGGTSLQFAYSRVPQAPADFLEIFLTGLQRTDRNGGADDVEPATPRTFTYYYQWPGGPVPSFVPYAQKVYDRYREFYATFIGCGFVPLSPCGERGQPRLSPGDPERLARVDQYAYISDVVDNIIRVDDTPILPLGGGGSVGRLPSIQSETRYETDPWSVSFDRAYAQRYGSTVAQQDPARIDPDRPGDNWASTLPKGTFSYSPARVAKLPRQIQDRYPLEAMPAAQPSVTIPPAGPGTPPGGHPICDYDQMDRLRTGLPGWTEPVEYFAPPPGTAVIEGSLASTPLSCEQLSAATYGDPTHNDLMSSLEPIGSTPQLFDHLVRRIVGQRSVTAANGNRICQWSSMRDRDGDLHFYGMNFRGQILVDALQERTAAGAPPSANFRYSETLYNADGMPRQQRRPVRGARRWQAADGYSLLEYDEIDPTGTSGWNEWLPAFWSRRMNLLRTEVHPRGGDVLDIDEKTNAFVRNGGRYQAFTFEPLFNQPASVESGSLARRTGPGATAWADVPHEKTTYVFDYQELSAAPAAPAGRSIAPVLESLRPWGFGWATTLTGDLDYNEITAWQLPVVFYDDDLNGDGLFGFGSAPGADARARGVPVTVVKEGNDPIAPPRGQLMSWAPHGRLAQLTGADGELLRLDYYRRALEAQPEAIFGGTSPAAATDVAGNYGGFLARIRTLRFQPYAPGTGPAFRSCALLAGPYEPLLPPGCTDPQSELAQLGLPQAAIDAILAAARGAQSDQDPERFETLSFSYNTLGGARYHWSESRATHYTRDTDGRLMRAVDPVGTRIENQYSTRGYPEFTAAFDAQGQLLAEVRRAHDGEGSIIYECVAKASGGCKATPVSGIERSFKYWPEGALREAVDPEGLVSAYDYDERGLLISERHRNPNSPADPPMQTDFQYDDDANLKTTTYAPRTPVQQTESFVYDGLQRATTHTDTRGYAWQTAYTSRDKVARQKRSDLPYGRASTPTSWETVFSHDDFGELMTREENGIATLRLQRTAGGRAFGYSAAGMGQTLATFDRSGRPAWMRDPAGTITVFTHRTSGAEDTTTVIRRAGQRQLATSDSVQLDAAEQPVLQIEYGGGDERKTSWVRDGLGRVTDETNPLGFVSRFHYDLAGFMRSTDQQRTDGNNPQFDTTQYDYDARGQVRTLTDPAAQITNFQYDGFGRLRERGSPGQPAVSGSFTYDPLGRLDIEAIGVNRIRHTYDRRGDPAQDLWLVTPQSSQVIAERTFDDLGRLRTARNMNPALTALPVARRTVIQELSYDSLGRVSSDSVRVGLQPAHAVSSQWTLPAGGLWQRAISYPLGAVTGGSVENYDSALRLTQSRSSSGLAARFSWLGDLYTGRDQDQPGSSSPFRELLSLDHFGMPIEWNYTAIDLDANRKPVNPADGVAYCGNTWNAVDCARPLMAMQALRDEAGRIASLNTALGHPLVSGGVLSPRTPAQPWRGYAYDPAGRLSQLWEHAGVTAPVSTAGLTTHRVKPSDIVRLGASAERWDYNRETAVGGTASISNSKAGIERWALPAPRGPGHELQTLRLDGQVRSVRHNTAGQVAADGKFEYSFDPRGQLATVLRNGQPVESYLYDAGGRLVAALGGSGTGPGEVFAYDGIQMVAAFSSANQPRWEAGWGPGVDHLITWRNVAAAGGDQVPLVDSRNSVVATWQAGAARITEIAEYDPEGRIELRDVSGNLICAERGAGNICRNPGRIPFGYAGAWRSALSGLVYMRNRWYSPELAQFISQDPAGFPDSYNAYAYAAFDPINQVDPFGLDGQLALRGRDIVEYEKEPGPGAIYTIVVCPSCHYDRSSLVGTTAREMTESEEKDLKTLTAAVNAAMVGGAIMGMGVGAGGVTIEGVILTPPAARSVAIAIPAVAVQAAAVTTGGATTFLVVMNSTGEPVDRAKYIGWNKRNKNTRPDSDPKKCAYCGTKNPTHTDHIRSVKNVDQLVKEGALTPKEAKLLVDNPANLVRGCVRCNSGLKKALDLGTGFKPKVPNEVITKLLQWAENESTRWLIGNATVTPLLPEAPPDKDPKKRSPKSASPGSNLVPMLSPL